MSDEHGPFPLSGNENSVEFRVEGDGSVTATVNGKIYSIDANEVSSALVDLLDSACEGNEHAHFQSSLAA